MDDECRYKATFLVYFLFLHAALVTANSGQLKELYRVCDNQQDGLWKASVVMTIASLVLQVLCVIYMASFLFCDLDCFCNWCYRNDYESWVYLILSIFLSGGVFSLNVVVTTLGLPDARCS